MALNGLCGVERFGEFTAEALRTQRKESKKLCELCVSVVNNPCGFPPKLRTLLQLEKET
jgi:hypothetical protein